MWMPWVSVFNTKMHFKTRQGIEIDKKQLANSYNSLSRWIYDALRGGNILVLQLWCLSNVFIFLYRLTKCGRSTNKKKCNSHNWSDPYRSSCIINALCIFIYYTVFCVYHVFFCKCCLSLVVLLGSWLASTSRRLALLKKQYSSTTQKEGQVVGNSSSVERCDARLSWGIIRRGNPRALATHITHTHTPRTLSHMYAHKQLIIHTSIGI